MRAALEIGLPSEHAAVGKSYHLWGITVDGSVERFEL